MIDFTFLLCRCFLIYKEQAPLGIV
jgi:hypothetical protein